MDTRINEGDIRHPHAFPDKRKKTVMRKIMSQKPDKSVQLNGRHDFEKILLKLRREEYGLIDLQRHDASFRASGIAKARRCWARGARM